LAQSGLLVGVLLFLSPILRTLTQSISSDTIYTLTVILLLIHLVAHDYAFVNANSDTFQCYLSLNSMIAVSILFASRLPSAIHSFGVIAFAILVFNMFPYLRHSIKRTSPEKTRWMTWVLALITFGIVFYSTSFRLASLYSFVMVFIIFIVPAWLITAQNYKEYALISMLNNYSVISGLWDEAVVPGVQIGD
jgi:phosphatidylinositol glycan class C protein